MGKRVENVAISIFRPVNQSGPPPLARKRYARHRVPRQGTIKISVNRCWNSLEKSLTDRFRILDLRGSEIVISSLPPCRGREKEGKTISATFAPKSWTQRAPLLRRKKRKQAERD